MNEGVDGRRQPLCDIFWVVRYLGFKIDTDDVTTLLDGAIVGDDFSNSSEYESVKFSYWASTHTTSIKNQG